jgi:hypothetical protein
MLQWSEKKSRNRVNTLKQRRKRVNPGIDNSEETEHKRLERIG